MTKKKNLQKICDEFKVKDVYELNKLNLKHDQKAIKEGFFNEKDPNLLNNRIKEKLLKLNLRELEKQEKELVQSILWLWYHHATTIAIWKDKDLSKAKKLCKKAMKYLYPNHPNKITPMIEMLLHGKIEEAKKWNKEEVNEAEKEYANHLLSEYKKGTFKEKSYK